MHPTNPLEVESLILQLDSHKAPGLDGLNNAFIKEIRDAISEPLAVIYNKSFSAGVFPDVWKLGSVCPIHKGGDSEVPGNYRPSHSSVLFPRSWRSL